MFKGLMIANGYQNTNCGKSYDFTRWSRNNHIYQDAQPHGWIFCNHGKRAEDIISKACKSGYEYLHGSYGLGYSVWYSYTTIDIVAKDGKFAIFGTDNDFKDELCALHCPEEWDFWESYYRPEMSKDGVTCVGVKAYEPAQKPHIVF